MQKSVERTKHYSFLYKLWDCFHSFSFVSTLLLRLPPSLRKVKKITALLPESLIILCSFGHCKRKIRLGDRQTIWKCTCIAPYLLHCIYGPAIFEKFVRDITDKENSNKFMGLMKVLKDLKWRFMNLFFFLTLFKLLNFYFKLDWR